jgi:4-diphosphocytidyl-2-C-methyl-D-erythritol kinase
MTRLIARAPAKLNLTFEVVGEMPDGYHEVSTLLQAVDLEDELAFEFSPHEAMDIRLSVSGEGQAGHFPLDDSNLIARAIRDFVACLPGFSGLKVSVRVDKRIPIGAGLAGGSADAAATLAALNYYFAHPLGAEELLALGARLGADVPFCLEGGTKVGRGRGDELTPVKHQSRLSFLLVKPRDLSLSTAWVYDAYDEFQPPAERLFWHPPDLVGAINGLTSGDLELATSCFGNDLEPVVFHHYPQLAGLKQRLLALGCWSCHLTGSGPALFAVAPDRESAHAVRRKFLAGEKGGGGGEAGNGQHEVDFWIVECVGYGARLVGEHEA